MTKKAKRSNEEMDGKVKVRRVYDAREAAQETRVLVDRIWPRGLTKNGADLDQWCQAVAPSTELRKWYGHDPDRFCAFAERYRAELGEPRLAEALGHLAELARTGTGTLTLLTATKAVEISAAVVLADVLARQAHR